MTADADRGAQGEECGDSYPMPYTGVAGGHNEVRRCTLITGHAGNHRCMHHSWTQWPQAGGSGAGSTPGWLHSLRTDYEREMDRANTENTQLRAALEAAQRDRDEAQKQWEFWQRAYTNLGPVHDQLKEDLTQARARIAALERTMAEREEVGTLEHARQHLTCGQIIAEKESALEAAQRERAEFERLFHELRLLLVDVWRFVNQVAETGLPRQRDEAERLDTKLTPLLAPAAEAAEQPSS